MNNAELTKKLQSKELQMLKELSEILKRNRIPFFLAYGTALGCARHRGFIPWDDDVDIFIKGTDYPKLKEVFKKQDTGNLALHDFEMVEDYPYFFPKIVAKDTLMVEKSLKNIKYRGGVYIDLFPLAEMPNSVFRQKVIKLRRYVYYSMIRGYYYNFKSVSKKVAGKIAKKMVNPVAVQSKLYKEYTRTEKECKFYSGSIDSGELYKKEYFDDIIYMPYEDAVMPMAACYKSILEEYYGDYMTLPDEENRVSNHNFERIVIENVNISG